ncbi:hypothetical protein [Streptomyces sp. bgisy060]|uniref:hypothetical protein n=1 Tax=Streptomyces sp. bgisy060 TaxID=3413775 RepID=UPI003EB98820
MLQVQGTSMRLRFWAVGYVDMAARPYPVPWASLPSASGELPQQRGPATAEPRYLRADAAYEADRTLDSPRDARRSAEALRVKLPPGRYRVQSLAIEPAPDTRFMLDRLLPE